MKKHEKLIFTETTRQMPKKGNSKHENKGIKGDKRTTPKKDCKD